MKKFIYLFHGGAGDPNMKPSADDMKKSMDEWMGWFAKMGDGVVDQGFQCMMNGWMVMSSGAKEGVSDVTGYTVIKCDSSDTAAAWAKLCPLLAAGGTVEIREEMPQMGM